MSSNQDEGMGRNRVELNITLDDNHNWDNNTMITWDYEGIDVMYSWCIHVFLGQKEGEYHVYII